MEYQLVQQVRHNIPFRSSAQRDQFEKIFEQSPSTTAKNDATVAKISVHRLLQKERQRFVADTLSRAAVRQEV